MRGLEALFDDPQVRHNGLVAEVEHPVAGKSEILGVPVRLSKTPGTVRTPAPTLGQHGEEILQELGYSSDDVRRLIQTGVIPQP
jgi:crotonobetainyl-CoA:carnitine CoA-transferase CaiB-like acyl-CoA transferase